MLINTSPSPSARRGFILLLCNGNVGVVKIGIQFTPIVGRVCMNHTMISLEGIDAKVGDEAIVYSDNPKDPNAIAAEHDLFNYALLTAISLDVRKVMV